MKTPMRTVSPEALEKAGPFLVSMKVSFGPAFSGRGLSNREFVQRLRDEAAKHSKSFLDKMMNHFADHIEAAISTGTINPDHEADLNPNTTYYGQGSCTGCPGDDGSGADCCLCSYNGQNVGCENCN